MNTVKYYERLWSWAWAWIPVIACIVAFGTWDEIKVDDILELQFSSNIDIFKALLNESSYKTLTKGHYFHFIFVFTYSTLFIISLLLIFELSNHEIYKKWSLFGILPGLFDCMENVIFLLLIDGREHLFTGYFMMTRIKWAFLILFFLLRLSLYFFTLSQVYLESLHGDLVVARRSFDLLFNIF